MSKTIVLYFGVSEDVETVAKVVADEAGADIEPIVPVDAYPTDYTKLSAQAREEMRKNYLPPIEPLKHDLAAYDTILIGSPNWFGSCAQPVFTVLDDSVAASKRIGLFITHGGSGAEYVDRDAKAHCPEVDFLPIFDCRGTGDEADIRAWVKSLNL